MSLKGIRVIDLTRVIAGPFCTQLLADLGADVIKIETPKGDPLRGQGSMVGGMSSYFASFNRNKRSVVLDLRDSAGMASLKGLIAGADVLVDNFKAGTMARMGLDDATLDALNPALTVCHISGFGTTGPYSDRPAFDFVVQAMSGFMWTNGEDGEAPMRSGLPVSDLVAGLYGSLAISAALAKPAKTRGFQAIDIAMSDCMVSLLAYMGTEALATGEALPRAGNDHPLVAPYGLFETADGNIAVAPSNDLIFARLLAVMDLGGLMNDPRFASNAERVRHRDLIRETFNVQFRCHPTDHWVALLNRNGVPAGPVLSVEEALQDPQTQHRKMVLEVPHPGHGVLRMMGFPIKQASDTPEMRRPAPDLGAHNSEVLAELRRN